MSELSPPAIRRNRALFVLDYAVFGVGMSFLAVTTVLPSLVRELGGSPIAVGSLGAIQSGCWLLPQLIAGRYSVNSPSVKVHAVVPALMGRISLILAMPLLMLFAVRSPGLALAALLIGFALFWIGDAASAPGWFELLGKAIPLGQRGRVMGLGQTVSGLAALGVGAAVTRILTWPNPFPNNYVLILLFANASFVVSVTAIALIHETRGAEQSETRMPWKEYGPRLRAIMRNDAPFRRLTVIRWLAGVSDMASGFYILFAADRLGISQSLTGAFITASVVGSLLAGVILGPLGDRHGSSLIVKVLMALRCIIPLPALLAPVLMGSHAGLGTALMLLVFAVMGLARGADFIGFMAYLLEITPPGERSVYVGLSNTLGGLVILAPLLAGWMLEWSSYEVLFAIVLISALLGLAVALRIPPGRHAHSVRVPPSSAD